MQWLSVAVLGLVLVGIGCYLWAKMKLDLGKQAGGAKRDTIPLFFSAVILPAGLAFIHGRYLIRNFFPRLTLIDLGAFYVVGFISGLVAGLILMRYKMTKMDAE